MPPRRRSAEQRLLDESTGVTAAVAVGKRGRAARQTHAGKEHKAAVLHEATTFEAEGVKTSLQTTARRNKKRKIKDTRTSHARKPKTQQEKIVKYRDALIHSAAAVAATGLLDNEDTAPLAKAAIRGAADAKQPGFTIGSPVITDAVKQVVTSSQVDEDSEADEAEEDFEEDEDYGGESEEESQEDQEDEDESGDRVANNEEEVSDSQPEVDLTKSTKRSAKRVKREKSPPRAAAAAASSAAASPLPLRPRFAPPRGYPESLDRPSTTAKSVSIAQLQTRTREQRAAHFANPATLARDHLIWTLHCSGRDIQECTAAGRSWFRVLCTYILWRLGHPRNAHITSTGYAITHYQPWGQHKDIVAYALDYYEDFLELLGETTGSPRVQDLDSLGLDFTKTAPPRGTPKRKAEPRAAAAAAAASLVTDTSAASRR